MTPKCDDENHSWEFTHGNYQLLTHLKCVNSSTGKSKSSNTAYIGTGVFTHASVYM